VTINANMIRTWASILVRVRGLLAIRRLSLSLLVES